MDRELDRVERETEEYRALIREAFVKLAARAPERYAVINADQTIDEVAAEVSVAVSAAMERANFGTAPVRGPVTQPGSPGGVEPWGTP